MAMEWVNVKDAMPQIGVGVYTYNIHGGLSYHVLYLDDDGKWHDDNYVENAEYDNPPTHWLARPELPLPPGGEGAMFEKMKQSSRSVATDKQMARAWQEASKKSSIVITDETYRAAAIKLHERGWSDDDIVNFLSGLYGAAAKIQRTRLALLHCPNCYDASRGEGNVTKATISEISGDFPVHFANDERSEWELCRAMAIWNLGDYDDG